MSRFRKLSQTIWCCQYHIVFALPKISILNFVAVLKERTAIRIFNRVRKLKNKPYWGNHFWSLGYCVDTVGLDEEMVRKYVKYELQEEQKQEK
ncbi:transposase [Desulfopila aestuarii]|uniref:Transposase IS200 like n=2 Tax=Desulfopila aestuarii TaxID=231440 RepID=A0A1M7YJG0_9BACT|nr:Transposase IS200 like [Desulfopila aestuarii DSM 18488]